MFKWPTVKNIRSIVDLLGHILHWKWIHFFLEKEGGWMERSAIIHPGQIVVKKSRPLNKHGLFELVLTMAIGYKDKGYMLYGC